MGLPTRCGYRALPAQWPSRPFSRLAGRTTGGGAGGATGGRCRGPEIPGSGGPALEPEGGEELLYILAATEGATIRRIGHAAGEVLESPATVPALVFIKGHDHHLPFFSYYNRPPGWRVRMASIHLIRGRGAFTRAGSGYLPAPGLSCQVDRSMVVEPSFDASSPGGQRSFTCTTGMTARKAGRSSQMRGTRLSLAGSEVYRIARTGQESAVTGDGGLEKRRGHPRPVPRKHVRHTVDGEAGHPPGERDRTPATGEAANSRVRLERGWEKWPSWREAGLRHAVP